MKEICKKVFLSKLIIIIYYFIVIHIIGCIIGFDIPHYYSQKRNKQIMERLNMTEKEFNLAMGRKARR